MRSCTCWLSLVTLLLLLWTTAPARAQQGRFERLGFISSNAPYSEAHGVSADGAFVVGYSNVDLQGGGSDVRAFRWSENDGMEILPPSRDEFDGQGFRTSSNGRVVVGIGGGFIEGIGAVTEAYRWEDGKTTGLGALPGTNCSWAYGISDDGRVVVGESYTCNATRIPQAFRWTEEEGMEALGSLPGLTNSFAYDASADGSIVIGYSSGWVDGNVVRTPIRWENGSLEPLRDASGAALSGVAHRITPDGRIIVGEASLPEGDAAFRWTEGEGVEYLEPNGDVLPGTPIAVSDDGSVIIGLGENRSDPYIWDEQNGTRSLIKEIEAASGTDLSDWSGFRPGDMSADGTVIVGHGRNPEGNMEAWRAVLGCPAGVGKTSPACTCSAPEVAWTNPAGGLFTEGANWRGGEAPGTDSVAVFDLNATYTVHLNGFRTNEALRVSGSALTLDLDWGWLALTGQSGCGDALRVEHTGDIDLTVRRGVFDTGDGDANVRGALLIEEASVLVDSDRDGNGTLMVSHPDGALLQIEEGAVVQAFAGAIVAHAAERGEIHVSGAESKFEVEGGLALGVFGTATMEVSGGAKASVDGLLMALLGNEHGRADVTVRGAKSLLSADSARVGHAGSGRLRILEGAAAGGGLSGVWVVGSDAGSDGAISIEGADSELFVVRLVVADAGQGALSVSGGGVARGIAQMAVGRRAGGQGTVTVTGPGSRLEVLDELVVGGSGHGELRVTGGSHTQVEGRTYVGQAASGAGAIAVSGAGSTLLLSEAFVGVEGIGVLGVEDEGHAEVAVLTVGPKGIIRGPVLSLATITAPPQGTPALRRASAAEIGIVVDSLRLSPGAKVEVEAMHVGGAGVLEVELGAEQDTVRVQGEARLGGRLRLRLANDFTPEEGQPFEILKANAITGAFEAIESPEGYVVELVYGERSISVTLHRATGTPSEEEELPSEYVLDQNYPNPFSEATTIRFELPEPVHVRLAVFDLLGREVMRLADRDYSAGIHEISVTPDMLQSGIYVYVLSTETTTLTRRMLLVK